MSDPKPPSPGAEEPSESAAVPPSNDTVAAPQSPITPTDPTVAAEPAAVDGGPAGGGASAPAPTRPDPADAEPVSAADRPVATAEAAPSTVDGQPGPAAADGPPSPEPTPPDPAVVDGQPNPAAAPPPAEPVTDTTVRPAAPVTGEPPIDMMPPPLPGSAESMASPVGSGAQPGMAPPPGAMPPPRPGSGVPTPPSGFGPPGMTVPGRPGPRRPGPITAAMVMLWVQVGLAFLGAALITLLVLLSVTERRYDDSGDYSGFITRSLVSSGVLGVMTLLFFGALMLAAAITLTKRLDLARTLTIAVMGFFVFSNLTVIVFTVINALLVSDSSAERVLVMVVLPLLAAGMPAAILVLLTLKPAVTWFYGDNRMPAER